LAAISTPDGNHLVAAAGVDLPSTVSSNSWFDPGGHVFAGHQGGHVPDESTGFIGFVMTVPVLTFRQLLKASNCNLIFMQIISCYKAAQCLMCPPIV